MAEEHQINLFLANPRGFCAGVSRAIEIVEKALLKHGSPLYVRHEIVHNKLVVEDLTNKGVIFVDELSQVPAGSNAIFSAHGVAESVYDEAKLKNLQIIDATCPLVRRVHFSARKHDTKGVQVVLIGHKGHPEVEGTMGQLPEGQMLLVENESDVEHLIVENPENLAYITQTTLSLDDTKSIIHALKNRFPKIMGPEEGDLCYATTNRQSAVKMLTSQIEVLLIIGSKNSSNCNRLRDLGQQHNIPSYLIDNEKDFQSDWLVGKTNIGISSGASTPESTVQGVVDYLEKNYDVKQTRVVEYNTEDVHFALPKELRT